MRELEIIIFCILIVGYAATFYIAGKSNLFESYPKIVAKRLEEATRKNGEWIIFQSLVDVTFMCSECEATFTEADREQKSYFNYCPNCGAKMKGGA